MSNEELGRVMIVDDTVENLQVLTALLETAGYQVSGAANGMTALMIAKNRPPNLILLDIRMPEMDGYEVCHRLKADEATRDIPVIFISTLNDLGDKIRGFEEGAVDYITKPFEENEVLARVSCHVSLFKMRKEMQEANVKLKALDKLMSMFIASMSHELRTPLNSIIGFSGILLQGISGRLSEKQAEDVGRINRSGKHLLGLISDVIDISKIEAGRIETYVETVSVRDVIEEAVEDISPMARGKGLSIVQQIDSVPSIVTDRKRLVQCVLNLLSNAVKYSEQGQIVISVKPVDEWVDITVADKGVGISKEDAERLFVAFERFDSRLKTAAGGTGLGLYLTRKIMTEMLQGEISVESEENKGSCFRLRIPLTLQQKK